MIWQFNPFAIPLLVAIFPIASFLVLGWQRRELVTARIFIAWLVAAAVWMGFYALELLTADLGLMMTWIRMEYLGILTLPALYFLFVLSYSGYANWITWRLVVGIFVVPVLQIIMVWTNDLHHLQWVWVDTQIIDGLIFFEREFGPGFAVGTAYQYLLILGGTVVLTALIIRTPTLYRGRIYPLIAIAAFVLGGNLVSILSLTPWPHLDFTPLCLAAASIPMAWSLFRQRLLDIMPAAHRIIFNNMSDAIVVLNVEQQVIDANNGAGTVLGKDPSQLIGRHGTQVFQQYPEILDACHNTYEVRAEISQQQGETRRWYDVKVSPIYDRESHLTGRVVVLHDISSIKFAEATVRQSAKELEEANKALEAFNRIVAHDLRAPIANVNMLAGITLELQASELSAETKENLTEIAQISSTMTTMVDELLLLAKLKHTDDKLVDVDVKLAAQAAVKRFQSDVTKHNIQINIQDDLPTANARSIWVEEVLANLIGNAIKYMGTENKEPRINIHGKRQDSFNRYEVADNGIGIQEADQKKLFEMFTRVHKGEATGMGLGLSIVAHIVHRLGGEAGVESTLDKGSTFWFTLPASRMSLVQVPTLNTVTPAEVKQPVAQPSQ
jgi:PAS domain S-box-containing protein